MRKERERARRESKDQDNRGPTGVEGGEKKETKRTGRILNLGDAFLAAALAEEHAGGGGVGEDVAADGLAAVGAGEEGRGARVGLDLIRLCFSATVTFRRFFGHACCWERTREKGFRTIRTQTLNSVTNV